MAELNFPDPVVSQEYETPDVPDVKWTWDGVKWESFILRLQNMGGLPILNTTDDFQTVTSGVRPDDTPNPFLKIPGNGGSTSDVIGGISMSGNNISSTSDSPFYGSAMRFNSGSLTGPQFDTRFYVGGSTKLTLEGWFNFDNPAFQDPANFLYNYLWTQYGFTDDNQGWEVTIVDSKPQFFWWAPDGTQNNIDSGQALAANTWYHIAVVFDDNNVKIFIDGSMKANSSFSTPGYGSRADQPQQFNIGCTFYDDGRQSETTGKYLDLTGYSAVKYTEDFVLPSL